ncbi:hypothetical protein C8R45DRAFT_948269 [Mycena sanguinolenta]|nr:hypothetical protein C8R45DRAFT_948269 [Mycena sanguinolenta]
MKGLFKSTSLLQSAKKLKDEADRENCIVNALEARECLSRVCQQRYAAAAEEEPTGTKHLEEVCNTQDQPMPHHPTLSCIRHRFVLSDASLWSDVDSDLDYMAYYNNIVDWFENAPGLRAQKEADELLVWWDQHVFKNDGAPAVPEWPQTSSSICAMRELCATWEMNM